MAAPTDIEPPDPALTAQQQAMADALSADVVAKIDAVLMFHARTTHRKVAMLVGLAMGDSSLRVHGLPDVFYAQRVRALVSRGLLLAEGDLSRMRYCEVRLP